MLKPPALCKKCGFDSQFEKIDAHRWPQLSRDQQNGRSAENGSRPPFPSMKRILTLSPRSLHLYTKELLVFTPLRHQQGPLC